MRAASFNPLLALLLVTACACSVPASTPTAADSPAVRVNTPWPALVDALVARMPLNFEKVKSSLGLRPEAKGRTPSSPAEYMGNIISVAIVWRLRAG